MSTRFTIDRLGAQGDGVAATDSGPVFIPFALPGETVTAALDKDRAMLISVVDPSPQRVAPQCQHFGDCGGCALQHLDAGAYLAWKRDKVVDALRAKTIPANLVSEIVPCAPASRRRAVFSARRTEKGMLLGYYRALSHSIVDVRECPILMPGIERALPRLRQLAAVTSNTAQPFHMTVLMTDTGFDVAFADSGSQSSERRREAIGFVLHATQGPPRGAEATPENRAPPIARLSVDGEILIEPIKPVVRFGDVSVSPPPGGFLQAVAGAEHFMAELVREHLRRSKRIADLFAGAGAFALRLARNAEVHAVESDQGALDALNNGFRFATGLKRVTTERRDLFRRPLTFKELNRFDGVVFDPPRAGAEDQAKQIARSDVAYVAAVSCNPTTLARDLRILLDGGYRLTSVTPIDQFLWSPHVEAVALLEKPKRRR